LLFIAYLPVVAKTLTFKLLLALTSDPYIKVNVGDQKFKTKVVKRDLSPSWSESFVFDIDSVTSDVVFFGVFDHERIGR
jgi:Ca2+-dependent lipid-binding protein